MITFVLSASEKGTNARQRGRRRGRRRGSRRVRTRRIHDDRRRRRHVHPRRWQRRTITTHTVPTRPLGGQRIKVEITRTLLTTQRLGGFSQARSTVGTVVAWNEACRWAVLGPVSKTPHAGLALRPMKHGRTVHGRRRNGQPRRPRDLAHVGRLRKRDEGGWQTVFGPMQTRRRRRSLWRRHVVVEGRRDINLVASKRLTRILRVARFAGRRREAGGGNFGKMAHGSGEGGLWGIDGRDRFRHFLWHGWHTTRGYVEGLVGRWPGGKGGHFGHGHRPRYRRSREFKLAQLPKVTKEVYHQAHLAIVISPLSHQ